MASTNGVSEVASSDVTKAQPSEQVVGEILCPITFNSTDTESESTNHQIIEALIDAGRQPVSQSADITPSLEHGYTLQNSVSVPKILLCCTGSVASVKVPQLVKLLSSMQCRPEVKLVTTKSALHFFSLMSVGCQTYTDGNEWELWRELKDPVLHIQLRHWADLLVISPLDANTLAKIAHGICDNLLTCVVRSWDVKRPLLFAPAMSTHMWQHAITARQLGILRSFGYVEIPSVRKKLAHSNKDVCAMAELETIVKEVEIVLLES